MNLIKEMNTVSLRHKPLNKFEKRAIRHTVKQEWPVTRRVKIDGMRGEIWRLLMMTPTVDYHIGSRRQEEAFDYCLECVLKQVQRESTQRVG